MITIDAATYADLPAIRSLARRIWNRHYPGIITQAQIDYMLDRGYATPVLAGFLGEPGAGLAVARCDGAPIAFAAWYRSDEPATTKLDKLYVAQEHQRAGVGRSLIEHVERAARNDGSNTLVLNVAKRNATSIEAYVHWGFARRAEVTIDIGNGFVMDDYVMAKPL